MITVKKAAGQANISNFTVRKYIRNGKIPAVKVVEDNRSKYKIYGQRLMSEQTKTGRIEQLYLKFKGEKIPLVGKMTREKLVKIAKKKKFKKKIKNNCPECIWGAKTAKEKYYCPFRGCLRGKN